MSSKLLYILSIVTNIMYRRKYLASMSATVSGLALAGCSGNGNSGADAEATIREYINAFCSKDAETVNELNSDYGIEGEATEAELYDAECSVSNIQEQSLPAATNEERFLQRDDVSELRYYAFTYTLDGETQDTTILLALQSGEWKVLDIG
ncbi:hypothetical protein [Natronomonas sp.]|uniref:hypothetical protein n=1 Tax=Natronomonas sp. TaxID=2184060 RepID=UPI00260EA8CA|nr:hypothetical protein [Natronomonas sp.]